MLQMKTNYMKENVLEKLPLGIIICENGGRVLFANAEARRLFQNNGSENADELPFEMTKKSQLAKLFRAVDSNSNNKRRTIEFLKNDRYLKVTVDLLNDEDADHCHFLLIIQDVTYVKELENVKADFVLSTLHKLRTPLTTVKTGLDFLLKSQNLSLTEQVKEIISMCRTETNRLTFFLNDLRDLFVIESDTAKKYLSPEPVAVRRIIQKALAAVKPLILEKKLVVKNQVEDSGEYITVDREAVYRVVENILQNAAVFTREFGIITLSLNDEESHVRLSIADTGIGISKTEINKIFEKFYRVDNEITRKTIGYGLGLYISKKMIELMDGNIYAYSVADKGSQFDLLLPK